uniref:Uncharacterized protein n=1 Tax=Pristionchus pacificus TaxID=54126 RepID=A0A2A6C6E6_PRIPA|eukprot:PDM73729.1 hypothetical protein PRIPAC_41085 [Pristionchus pacificus]
MLPRLTNKRALRRTTFYSSAWSRDAAHAKQTTCPQVTRQARACGWGEQHNGHSILTLRAEYDSLEEDFGLFHTTRTARQTDTVALSLSRALSLVKIGMHIGRGSSGKKIASSRHCPQLTMYSIFVITAYAQPIGVVYQNFHTIMERLVGVRGRANHPIDIVKYLVVYHGQPVPVAEL